MPWFEYTKFSPQRDLTGLHKILIQCQVPHRITETADAQVLWLSDPQHIPPVEQLVESFNEHPDSTFFKDNAETELTAPSSLVPQLKIVPLTAVILVLGLLGYLLNLGNLRGVIAQLLYFPPEIYKGQFWRLITPVFIHWDILHIVFNGMWIWEVGKRLECRLGRWRYLSLFLVSGIFSNAVQYSISESPFFGGLSGVVYAYFGCIIVVHRVYPRVITRMPKGLYVVMLAWLVVGFLGWGQVITGNPIANWAHFAGLVAGLACGAVFCLIAKLTKRPPQVI